MFSNSQKNKVPRKVDPDKKRDELNQESDDVTMFSPPNTILTSHSFRESSHKQKD